MISSFTIFSKFTVKSIVFLSFLQDLLNSTLTVKLDGIETNKGFFHQKKIKMIIKGEAYIFKIGKKEYHCAMDVTMDFIGGKWKTVVLWYLIGGKKRFGELKKRIPNITDKMLSIQLKALEKDGLIKRKVYPQVPPKVEYSLTKDGETMIPLLNSIAEWGRNRAETKGKMLKKK